jgi:hypothetical protein
MLNLKVDECYAFDYMAILFIKRNKSIQALKTWEDCYRYIRDQLDEKFFNEIIDSKEYEDMIDANQKTFNMVERAKNNSCTAMDVDKCNYGRHRAKEKFQEKFFGTPMSEIKIGYEKYK